MRMEMVYDDRSLREVTSLKVRFQYTNTLHS